MVFFPFSYRTLVNIWSQTWIGSPHWLSCQSSCCPVPDGVREQREPRSLLWSDLCTWFGRTENNWIVADYYEGYITNSLFLEERDRSWEYETGLGIRWQITYLNGLGEGFNGLLLGLNLVTHLFHNISLECSLVIGLRTQSLEGSKSK